MKVNRGTNRSADYRRLLSRLREGWQPPFWMKANIASRLMFGGRRLTQLSLFDVAPESPSADLPARSWSDTQQNPRVLILGFAEPIVIGDDDQPGVRIIPLGEPLKIGVDDGRLIGAPAASSRQPGFRGGGWPNPVRRAFSAWSGNIKPQGRLDPDLLLGSCLFVAGWWSIGNVAAEGRLIFDALGGSLGFALGLGALATPSVLFTAAGVFVYKNILRDIDLLGRRIWFSSREG